MYHKDGNTYRNAVHYRLHDTLIAESKLLRGDDWPERQRKAMLRVVNDERLNRKEPGTRHCCPLPLSEVERVEQLAVGHTDYGIKFALYCSELVDLHWQIGDV